MNFGFRKIFNFNILLIDLRSNRREDISKYGLYLTEDDGEVDWDFPCLDPRETIAKFEFTTLGLVEMKESDRARHDTVGPITKIDEEPAYDNGKEQQDIDEDLARMEGHTTAMEAPLYQLYRFVRILAKNRLF